MLCGVVWCSAVQYSAVQCSSVQCSAVQCSALQCSAVQCSAVQCSAVQCSAVQCNILHCIKCLLPGARRSGPRWACPGNAAISRGCNLSDYIYPLYTLLYTTSYFIQCTSLFYTSYIYNTLHCYVHYKTPQHSVLSCVIIKISLWKNSEPS